MTILQHTYTHLRHRNFGVVHLMSKTTNNTLNLVSEEAEKKSETMQASATPRSFYRHA